MKSYGFATCFLLAFAGSSAAFANPFATGSGFGSGYSQSNNPKPSPQEGNLLFSFQEIPSMEFQEIQPIQFFDRSSR